jgi:hypothetical protein
MDLSEQLFDKRRAIELGYKKKPVSNHDAAKGEVITLPSRQTFGTYTQRVERLSLQLLTQVVSNHYH